MARHVFMRITGGRFGMSSPRPTDAPDRKPGWLDISVSDELQIADLISSHVRDRAESNAAEVERRILEGENRVEIPYGINQRTVHLVPTWRQHPRDRLRVELARLKYRLAQRQQRWGG